jgi:Fe2+ transport system protein FeoA
MPGRSVRVVQKIRGGPVVIDTGQAEVAVGYTLARRITVALESPAD